MFIMRVDIAVRFSQSEVKGQGHSKTKCPCTEGIYFNSVASRLIRFGVLLPFLAAVRLTVDHLFTTADK